MVEVRFCAVTTTSETAGPAAAVAAPSAWARMVKPSAVQPKRAATAALFIETIDMSPLVLGLPRICQRRADARQAGPRRRALGVLLRGGAGIGRARKGST
jgi:hypothetical protein